MIASTTVYNNCYERICNDIERKHVCAVRCHVRVALAGLALALVVVVVVVEVAAKMAKLGVDFERPGRSVFL
jgi:hypothetical protein